MRAGWEVRIGGRRGSHAHREYDGSGVREHDSNGASDRYRIAANPRKDIFQIETLRFVPLDLEHVRLAQNPAGGLRIGPSLRAK